VKKALVVLLAMFLAAAAWAQTDQMLGPHNVGNAGCESCHAPHNALPGQGAYLWGISIPTGTYTTYTTSDGNGGTLNAGSMSSGSANATVALANLPMAHTVLCLSCHDTTFSGMAASIPTSTTKGSNFAIGAGGTLSNSHPVDVAYPKSDPTYWTFNTPVLGPNNTYVVTFTDTTYAYGHPARLFSVDGSTAYVECGSCHNPHAQLNAVVPGVGGNVGVCTTHFIRGQYRATNESLGTPGCTTSSSTYTADNANFCMSCHSYPSSGFTGSVH
jgi:cytochrome c553